MEFLVLFWVGVCVGWSLQGVHRGLSVESLLLIKLLPKIRGRPWRWVVDMWEGVRFLRLATKAFLCSVVYTAALPPMGLLLLYLLPA